MGTNADRWEHGSEFHWLGAVQPISAPAAHPWSARATLFGSGRDALRALIRHESGTLGWKRVLIPSFLCQEVVVALVSEGLEVDVYFDDPRGPIAAPCPGFGEALLVVNTFGVRPRWPRPKPCPGSVIEDHTHDPWSEWARTSDADYCIASLRKTLPVPDGGVVWSPTGLPLPFSAELTPAHAAASARKLEAMLLKALFLEGHAVDKRVFRTLALAGEAAISTQEVSAMSPVSLVVANCLDVTTWRERRRENHRTLASKLDGLAGLKVIYPTDPGSCPFALCLLCRDAEVRDHLRAGLIAQSIYPAILWPLGGHPLALPEANVELSRRLLSIHCDGRYDDADMLRVAGVVEKGHLSAGCQ